MWFQNMALGFEILGDGCGGALRGGRREAQRPRPRPRPCGRPRRRKCPPAPPPCAAAGRFRPRGRGVSGRGGRFRRRGGAFPAAAAHPRWRRVLLGVPSLSFSSLGRGLWSPPRKVVSPAASSKCRFRAELWLEEAAPAFSSCPSPQCPVGSLPASPSLPDCPPPLPCGPTMCVLS